MIDKGRFQRRSATSLVDRRQFLRRTAAGAALPAMIGMLGGSARAQAKTVNVASYGGVVQDYQTRLFAQPFEAKTGVKVNIGSNASLALVKLQNSAGTAAQWDICSLSGAEYHEAIAQKLIVPYDYSIIDTTNILPEYKQSHGIKFSLFLFVMAWDKRQIPTTRRRRPWPSSGTPIASRANARSMPASPTAARSRWRSWPTACL